MPARKRLFGGGQGLPSFRYVAARRAPDQQAAVASGNGPPPVPLVVGRPAEPAAAGRAAGAMGAVVAALPPADSEARLPGLAKRQDAPALRPSRRGSRSGALEAAGSAESRSRALEESSPIHSHAVVRWFTEVSGWMLCVLCFAKMVLP